jgi:hypothetical protein
MANDSAQSPAWYVPLPGGNFKAGREDRLDNRTGKTYEKPRMHPASFDAFCLSTFGQPVIGANVMQRIKERIDTVTLLLSANGSDHCGP